MGRFDKLPGIDGSNTTRRNVVVGGVYALAGCTALGAITGDSEDTGNGNGNEGSTDSGNGSGDGNTETENSNNGDTSESNDSTEPEGEQESDTEDEDGQEGDTEGEEKLPEAGNLSAVSANTDWLDDSVALSGEGQTVTDTFEASRFTTFVYDHDGESNFIIELINDSTGETEDILVNEIGTVSGAVGVGLADDTYLLDVDADGAWSIELGKPFAPDGEWGVPPATIEGEQTDVYGEVEIDGRVTVSGQHEGESNFIVSAWDKINSRGFADEIIFNEIGEFEGETSVQLSGLFYITVQADGRYRIGIE